MTVSNLGICLAPTLMRGPDESAPSIIEIRYSNVVTNTLIEDYDTIFNDHIARNNVQQRHNQNQNSQPNYIEQTSHSNSPFTLSNSPFTLIPIQANDKIHYCQPPSQYFNQQIQQQSQPYFEQPPPWQHFPYFPQPPLTKLAYRSDKVISLYACVADNLDSELSFGPNEIIIDGKSIVCFITRVLFYIGA